jgi:hypothetical protein
VWLIMLSHQLLIEGLVSRYLTNYLIRRTPISIRRNFNRVIMRIPDTMGYYFQFPGAIPQMEVSCIRVTHPFAGFSQVQALDFSLDLHVLSLPLAFILSQYQTLHCLRLFVIDWLLTYSKIFWLLLSNTSKNLYKNLYVFSPIEILYSNGSQSYFLLLRFTKFFGYYFSTIFNGHLSFCIFPSTLLFFR